MLIFFRPDDVNQNYEVAAFKEEAFGKTVVMMMLMQKKSLQMMTLVLAFKG
ncbi:hypothetical protein DPMN_087177 [Dreissena polymorpha]|uniref:Uncharacterized protein n=1 Tax=Dreissena polymorpha TaxID=45954 RepID=A0A9D4KS75_DREPO|nr:hypothetical protein DPMN_087177 [Dreissena polymorpha]